MLSSDHQPDPKLLLLAKLMLAADHDTSLAAELANDVITAMAIEHGVAAILADVLRHDATHTQFFESLSRFQQHQHLRNQLLAEQYQHTLLQLAETGIDFVVLKGYALGHTVYKNPLLRTKSDVDIIIAESDKNNVKTALTTLGYSNPRGWDPTEIINQFSMRKTLSPGLHVDFDIHLHLSNELGVEDILTFDELAESAETGQLNSIPLVCKAHGLIHAIVHLLHHRNVGDTVKLIWLYDLLLLCQKMNNSEKAFFRQCVDKKGLAVLATFALNLANQYFEDASITSMVEFLKGTSADPELVYLIKIDSLSNRFYRSLRQRKTIRGKWVFIQEMAFPPAQEIYQKYGKQPKYLLPFLYIRRIFSGIVKHLFN